MSSLADAEGVQRYLTDDVLARMRAPTPEARGLPNAAFVSDDFFALERRVRASFAAACMASRSSALKFFSFSAMIGPLLVLSVVEITLRRPEDRALLDS